MNTGVEVWKPVVGYEGLYEASNHGNVRSLNRYDSMGRLHFGRRLATGDNGHGYATTKFCVNGVQTTLYTHRIVGQAFLENPANMPEINHKDGNKRNNCVENLEWCDRAYNNNYGDTPKHKKVKIAQISKSGELIAIYESIQSAELQTGICRSNISEVCRGIRKIAGGYGWEYRSKPPFKPKRKKKGDAA